MHRRIRPLLVLCNRRPRRRLFPHRHIPGIKEIHRNVTQSIEWDIGYCIRTGVERVSAFCKNSTREDTLVAPD